MRNHIATFSAEIVSIGVGVVVTTLGVWAGGVLIVVGLLGLVWSWSGRRADKAKRATLVISGDAKAVERVTKEAVALHRGESPTAEGNVIVLVKAVFNPTSPSLPIGNLKLDVSGVELETELPPREVSKGSTWEGYFEIPQSLEVRNINASLVAYIGAERFTSPEFPIPFDKLGE